MSIIEILILVLCIICGFIALFLLPKFYIYLSLFISDLVSDSRKKSTKSDIYDLSNKVEVIDRHIRSIEYYINNHLNNIDNINIKNNTKIKKS